jgi:SAM-dependent methyltransferase
VSEDGSESITRHSFERQTELFTGDDAPFAHTTPSPNAWIGTLEPDMLVLDVACGAAHVAEQIAPCVRQVVGVDVTRALLDLGAERLRAAGTTNVLLQEGNATALPFVDASFDVVVCRGALHHFSDPARAVAEMARVCRPDGHVAVSDMVAPSARTRDAFDALHRLMDPSHAGVLLDVELAALLDDTVGPVAAREAQPAFRLPIEHILTEVADRDAVMSTLRAELDGGDPTGFEPRIEGDEVTVAFASAVVRARRAASAG